MRKLLITLMLLTGILLFSFAIDLEEEFGYNIYIESHQIEYRESSGVRTEEEYYLYIGNETTRIVDDYLSGSGFKYSVTLFHPLPEVAEFMFSFPAHLRWYVVPENSFEPPSPQGLMAYEVFTDQSWSNIAQGIKHTMFAFGVNNDNLMVIYFSFFTGSIKIYFHNQFASNLEYYERQERTLRAYFEQLDNFNAPLNFSR